MDEIVAQLGEWIERHRMWAGPVLGLITFGESLAFVGALFPATALMVVAGGLAATGVLDPVSVALWCVAGAVAGDAVSYWIGRGTGPRLWRGRRSRRWRRTLAGARLYFRKWGAASIYFCRFMGPVRAFVPLMAGASGMRQGRFQLANAGSALVWVPVMLAPGYLTAKGVGAAGEILDANLVLLAVAAAAVLAAGVLAGRGLKARLARPNAGSRG